MVVFERMVSRRGSHRSCGRCTRWTRTLQLSWVRKRLRYAAEWTLFWRVVEVEFGGHLHDILPLWFLQTSLALSLSVAIPRELSSSFKKRAASERYE